MHALIRRVCRGVCRVGWPRACQVDQRRAARTWRIVKLIGPRVVDRPALNVAGDIPQRRHVADSLDDPADERLVYLRVDHGSGRTAHIPTPTRSILFRHLLPNGITPVLVSASFGLTGAILAESTLSFLGIGLVGEASWGQLAQSSPR